MQLKQLQNRSQNTENSGLQVNRIETRDPAIPCAVLYQLSYLANVNSVIIPKGVHYKKDVTIRGPLIF